MNDGFEPKSFAEVPLVTLVSPSPCKGTEMVLVYVPSVFSQVQRRRTIRSTWADTIVNGPLNAKLVFVLGVPSAGEASNDHMVETESKLFDDLIRLDVVDHYHNLTLKTRAIFNWALQHCPKIEFLIRADSDIVLHAGRLHEFLNYHRSLPSFDLSKPLVFGQCRPYDCVTRLPWSKSCLPRSFYETMGKPLFYPSYCFGFSSILSMEYVRRASDLWKRSLSRNSLDVKDYLPMEDLHSIGYTGEAIGAWKVGHKKLFVYDQYFDSYSCHDGAIASAAYDDEEEMKVKWKRFRDRCFEESE